METRLTYSGSAGAWTAVLRAGRKVLAECGHTHRNRGSGNDNAATCGLGFVLAARNRHTTAILIVDQAVAAAGRARQLGARITDDEARDKTAATIAAWRRVVLTRDVHTKPDWSQRNAGRTCGCCPRGTTPQDPTDEDTTSAVSRLHYAATGRYLTVAEVINIEIDR